jgi:hypothetical protein
VVSYRSRKKLQGVLQQTLFIGIRLIRTYGSCEEGERERERQRSFIDISGLEYAMETGFYYECK